MYTNQKFGRLVGVNLEIRAFATDPQNCSERASTSFQEENAMDETFLRSLELRTQSSLVTKNKTRSSGVVVNMPPCHGGDRGFESLLDRH